MRKFLACLSRMLSFIVLLQLSLMFVVAFAKTDKLASSAENVSMNIGVVDMRYALLNSSAAQKYGALSQKTFQLRMETLTKRRHELQEKETALNKDALVLSKTDLEKKREALEREKNDFLEKWQKLQEEKELADQKEIERLTPLLKQAVRKIAESKGFILILDEPAVPYHRDAVNMTHAVINALNEITEPVERNNKKVKEK